MDREKIKNYLGICRKAGYAIVGSDKLKNYDKKLYLVIADKDISKTIQKVVDKFNQVETVFIDNLEELVEIENCKIVGIKNFGLSEEIKKQIRGE